jgi:hypothetical protein
MCGVDTSGSDRSSSLGGLVVSACWSFWDSSSEEFGLRLGVRVSGVGALVQSMSVWTLFGLVLFLLLCVSGVVTDWELLRRAGGGVVSAVVSRFVVGVGLGRLALV